MSLRSRYTSLLLLPLAFACGIYDAALLRERPEARAAQLRGCSPCMALVDPTVDPVSHAALPFLADSDPATAAALKRGDPLGFAYLGSLQNSDRIVR